MKVRNIFGSEFRGAIGKNLVASSWKGHDYLRAYVVPRDPKSELQLEQRGLLREAVAAWRDLSASEKKACNREAKGMSGFNLFVSRYIRKKRRTE